MQKTNMSAGMGDPYWYEWLVGGDYALDMLSLDNGIEYVTLQASEFQGLDDVVIGYTSGEICGVQVKHTRENASLTFSDLIYSKPNKISLLKELFEDWKKMWESGRYLKCDAVLLTNRKGGVRKSTIGKKTDSPIVLPALKDFWDNIKRQIKNEKCTNLGDINIDKQWKAAWDIFLNELSDSDDQTKFEFIKSFYIKTNQDDLDGYVDSIKRKLFKYFKADEHQITRFEQQICYAIREWSTTRRHSEKITREDLFEALSLASDNPVGDHNIPACFPFFQSRINFINNLEGILKERIRPIVFLSGNPGSGKTNIVSYMANKSYSIIDLRFHAFKPIQPGDTYLPSDQGISDSKALWGDLLIQLRELLEGRLAEFDVPVSNEILGSFEKMRAEVLRIADLYGRDQNKVVVIAIDGIDHAARAGETNNFLKTLVPPEGVPDNVCFLIVGQPLKYYDLYPDWLSDEKAIIHLEVPDIEKEDIVQLLTEKQIALKNCTNNRIAEIIINSVKGNTLSAVFAVYECTNLTELKDLEERLEKVPFSSGIQAYYEYIWKETKKHIPDKYWYLDIKIATILSMYTKRITTQDVMMIFQKISLPEIVWDRVFKSLFPIVIQDEGGFRVFHNDVRVYLQKYIKREMEDFQESCFEIADFLFSTSGDVKVRHEIGFQLLKYAKRKDLFLQYFTPEYVLDSIYLKRPMQEIVEQLEDTIAVFSYNSSLSQKISFECAIETLSQYQQSLQWQETNHISEIKLPDILPCEKRVPNLVLFTAEEVARMFSQVNWLIDEGEICRAKEIINRWINSATPYAIVSKLAENEGRKIEHDYVNKDEIKDMLEEWGNISYRLNLETISPSEGELEKLISAYWSKGWLKSAQKYYSPQFINKWREQKNVAFVFDIEEMFGFLLEHATVEEILIFVQETKISEFSYMTKVYWVCWAIIHNEGEHCIQVLEEILTNGIEPLEKRQYSREKETVCVCGVIIAFINKVYGNMCIENFDTFVSNLLEKATGHEVKKDEHGYFSANNLILAGILMADIFKRGYETNEDDTYDEEIEIIIETIFDERDGIGCVEIGGIHAKRYLLELLLYLSNDFPKKYEIKVIDMVTECAKITKSLTLIKIWWPYLKSCGKEKELYEIFNKWMDLENGEAWNQELYEVHRTANVLLPLALEMGWDKEVKEIKEVLEGNKVGYVGRKDYSLYKPLEWFETIEKSDLSWQHFGLELLNISDYASRTGDNRAAIRIEGAVAAIVGNKGKNAIDAFIRTINPSSMEEFQIILDAIIESFCNNYISNSDIFLIWKTVVDLLNINHSLPEYDSTNSIKIIYLVDLRIAIDKYFENHPQNDRNSLEIMMKEYSPFEYQIEKGPEVVTFYLPNRWFEQEDINVKADKFKEENETETLQDAFENLREKIEAQEQSRWNMAIGFLDMLDNSSEQKDVLVDEIFNLIMQFRADYAWEYDGIYRLYNKMWPFLRKDQKEQLYESMATNYDYYKDLYDNEILPNLYEFSNDIHRLILCENAEFDNNDRLKILDTLLSMHLNWITASSRRPFYCKYVTIQEEKNATWTDICNVLRELLDGLF